jgi:integrase
MASVRRRGKAENYEVRWHTGNGLYGSESGFTTKRNALRYGQEQEVKARRNKTTKVSERNKTLYEYVRDNWSKTLDVKRQTREDYQRALNTAILPVLGPIKLVDLKRTEIEAWKVNLKKVGPNGKRGLSDSTVNKHLHLLGAIIKMAIDDGYIDKSPIPIKRGKRRVSAKRKIVPYIPATVNRIADAFPEKWRILIWIMYYTGLRPSEALGLTYDRLDFMAGTITVDRQLSRYSDEVFSDTLKTYASYRVIGFSKILQTLISEHVSKYGLGPENLILQNRSGRIWRYKDAAAMFREVLTSIGIRIDGEGLHNLRHTFVSNAIRRGVSAKRIQVWVGHKSITETMDTYGHLFPDDFEEMTTMIDMGSWEDTELSAKVEIA